MPDYRIDNLKTSSPPVLVEANHDDTNIILTVVVSTRVCVARWLSLSSFAMTHIFVFVKFLLITLTALLNQIQYSAIIESSRNSQGFSQSLWPFTATLKSLENLQISSQSLRLFAARKSEQFTRFSLADMCFDVSYFSGRAWAGLLHSPKVRGKSYLKFVGKIILWPKRQSLIVSFTISSFLRAVEMKELLNCVCQESCFFDHKSWKATVYYL
jgi:hypothetical protein